MHWLLLGARVDEETAASLGAAMAEHSGGDSVEQLVVLSSVDVYGEAVREAGGGAELSEAALEARELEGGGAEAGARCAPASDSSPRCRRRAARCCAPAHRSTWARPARR